MGKDDKTKSQLGVAGPHSADGLRTAINSQQPGKDATFSLQPDGKGTSFSLGVGRIDLNVTPAKKPDPKP